MRSVRPEKVCSLNVSTAAVASGTDSKSTNPKPEGTPSRWGRAIRTGRCSRKRFSRSKEGAQRENQHVSSQ